GLRQHRIDHVEPLALLDLIAALDRPFDQPAGSRWCDQAGLAFDIAEIARAFAAEAQHRGERTLEPDTGGDHDGRGRGHDDESTACHETDLTGRGLRACSIRSA